MLSRPAVVALLAALCIIAAAGGAYVAVRHNAQDRAAAALATPAEQTVPTAPAQMSPAVGVTAQAQQLAPAGATASRPADIALAQPETTDRAPAVLEPRPPTPRQAVKAEPPTTGEAVVAEIPEAKQVTPVASGRPWPSPPTPPSDPSQTPPVAPAGVPPAIPPAPAAGAPPPAGAPVSDPTLVSEIGAAEQRVPAKEFEDLMVPADAVLGLQLETTISSADARVEDQVEARVTRDVRVGERVAIPAGTRAIGSVVQVERGGKIRTTALLAVRFHTLILADSTRLTVNTDVVRREGESPASKSAAKIGGAAIGGAILGAILGGGRGAAIGGSIGAAGGAAAAMAGDVRDVILPAGTLMTVRVLTPFTVTIAR